MSADDDDALAATCCVCLERTDYNGSALVRCASCNLPVHVRCYGTALPPGGAPWRCEPCEYQETAAAADGTLEPPMRPRCAVCPVEGGALRRSSQPGVWVHVLCATWIPELSHSLSGELDQVVDVALLDRSRESLRCIVCGQRGGCIQCVSGRCARAFHVLCAIRAPSSLVFTGYNAENQQVYHCKTHLADVANARYEMVDDSWRHAPRVRDFLEAHPAEHGKCRVCQVKTAATNHAAHETQCLLAWLTREESKLRADEMKRRGLKPIEIAYGARGKSHSAKNSKRQHAAMRPCPECGDSVREALMASHLKSGCSYSNSSSGSHAGARRAKNPNRMKRKMNGHAASASADMAPEEQSVAVASDLTDVLFATWPGQNAGVPMDSTYLWKTVGNNFYSSKALMKKRMEQLCKTTCGAKLEDIGNFSRKLVRHDLMDCADTVLLDREAVATAEGDGHTEALHLKANLHRCDFMMRASRSRCVEDIYAQPSVHIHSLSRSRAEEVPETPAAPESEAAATKDVPPAALLDDGAASEFCVRFSNHENVTVDCKYAMKVTKSGAADRAPPADGSFWSSFRHDVLSTLAGAAVDTHKVPLGDDDHLWLTMKMVDERDGADGRIPTGNNIPTRLLHAADDQWLTDELTPEISLLVENLNEQMKQNRFRLRTLSKKLQLTDHHEGLSARAAGVTESYYKEFAAWKRLCKSLTVGYRDIRHGEPLAQAPPTEPKKHHHSDSSGSSPSVDEDDGEDAIDDGTCVVCFDGQSPESNPIVFCDRCDLAVHQGCYGIVELPNNEFFCDRCSVEDDGEDPALSVFCQLCSLRDGAFKRTVDGKWVHVVCALWCPKVWIGNLQNLSEINLVAAASPPRFVDTMAEVAARLALAPPENQKVSQSLDDNDALTQGSLCMHCKVACGRTIRCSHPDCTAAFHPLCGWFEGLPMTIKLGPRGYVYAGGGAGLQFQMHCLKHLPAHYPDAERLIQRKRRRRFRIDSFYVTQCKLERALLPRKPLDRQESHSLLSGPIMQALLSADGKRSGCDEDASVESYEWIDRAPCSACFQFSSPVVGDELDVNKLHKRQFLMRCQYCSTFIHPECCLSETGAPSEIFQSNWICERCTLVGNAAPTPCVVCDKACDYLMACNSPASGFAPPAPVATKQQQLQLATNAASRLLTLSPHPSSSSSSSSSANTKDRKLLNVAQQIALGKQQTHTPPPASTTSTPYDKWMHVFCAKWVKAKLIRKNRILCAQTPSLTLDGHAFRCEICSFKGRNLANCAHCQKRFHPLCAAKKRFYFARSAKQEWKFYCDSHPPPGVVYDESRQSWMTTEILGQLQDLRRSLERGRMILEMSRQRDRQQKRIFSLYQIPTMEASIEIVLKKRPTAAMREAFQSLTGEVLTDTPRRPRPQPSPSSKRTQSKSRARSAEQQESSDEEEPLAAAATPSRRSSRFEEEHDTPSTRSRKRQEPVSSRAGNSKRRRLELEVEPESPQSSVDGASRRRSSTRSKAEESGSATQGAHALRGNMSPSELKRRFLTCLERVTAPSDFDDVVEELYPELMD